MRCVKETLPPRARARLELITTRLSMSSLAGTARTLVAVGTSRLVTMLVAIALAGPRSTETVSSSGVELSLAALGSWAGIGGGPVLPGRDSLAAGAEGLPAGAAAGLAGVAVGAGAAGFAD